MQGGPLTMVALTNREANFGGVASTDPVVGWDKGIKTLAISAFTGSLDMQFTARKDWMSRVGVSPKSPLEDKLKALQGRAYRRFDHRRRARAVHALPRTHGRARPRSRHENPCGRLWRRADGGAAHQSGRRHGRRRHRKPIRSRLEGFGELFIDCAHEVPLFREFPYTVALVTPQFANEQPDVVRRIAHTFGQANDMFHTKFR